ncbi:helix-turn-helix domain-containing protein [Lysinibacillus antri]|uniref:XRE family transcriptional regulator n=1 Tax=Lysinibacillus antri TaxID=2498145 RepID=A0A3S0P5G8_9BACI|nr:helix-turn-helix transcriptional regulator [Lysinibacillus antri]RUL47224.1 XRE family transcriptional regulator [Lysinibacillus antri]
MEEIVQVVGERIRNFRKERGLSQEELAHQASLHNTYIGQLERGEKNATIESLYKITNALGITLEELFHNTQTGPKANSLEITQIISLLENKSKKDQHTLLQLLELLVNWKDNN